MFWKYILTRYLMLYLLREILESDDQGIQIIENPSNAMRCENQRLRFRECIKSMLGDLVVDLNFEVREEGEISIIRVSFVMRNG